jgi:hypothetical protein
MCVSLLAARAAVERSPTRARELHERQQREWLGEVAVDEPGMEQKGRRPGLVPAPFSVDGRAEEVTQKPCWRG